MTLPNNWQPRAYQLPAWEYLENGGKLAYLVWHRRAGKDDVFLHWSAVAAHQRIGTYWHLLPQASQARKAIWEAINPHTGKRRIDEAFPVGLRAVTRENEMFIRFKNGSTWQVVGSDNYDSLVGSPPVGVVFSEWALAKSASWAYLSPILAENGGWAAFVTTPRGKNHAERMYNGLVGDAKAFVQRLTVRDTSALTPEQQDEQLRRYIADFGETEGRAKFDQEYLCSFSAANQGAIYAKEIIRSRDAKRIRKVPYEPAKLVHTAWDLGRGDSTAIWFWQMVGGEVRFIDFYESRAEVITHYLATLKARGYQYEKLKLPHDAEHKLIVSDKSVVEICRANGFGADIVANLPITEGINSARLLLGKALFDAEKCKAGLEALESYCWDYNERMEEHKPTPRHDWASHAADAFRYAALSVKEDKPVRKLTYDARGYV